MSLPCLELQYSSYFQAESVNTICSIFLVVWQPILQPVAISYLNTTVIWYLSRWLQGNSAVPLHIQVYHSPPLECGSGSKETTCQQPRYKSTQANYCRMRQKPSVGTENIHFVFIDRFYSYFLLLNSFECDSSSLRDGAEAELYIKVSVFVIC